MLYIYVVLYFHYSASALSNHVSYREDLESTHISSGFFFLLYANYKKQPLINPSVNSGKKRGIAIMRPFTAHAMQRACPDVFCMSGQAE